MSFETMVETKKKVFGKSSDIAYRMNTAEKYLSKHANLLLETKLTCTSLVLIGNPLLYNTYSGTIVLVTGKGKVYQFW